MRKHDRQRIDNLALLSYCQKDIQKGRLNNHRDTCENDACALSCCTRYCYSGRRGLTPQHTFYHLQSISSVLTPHGTRIFGPVLLSQAFESRPVPEMLRPKSSNSNKCRLNGHVSNLDFPAPDDPSYQFATLLGPPSLNVRPSYPGPSSRYVLACA
jgi:hypothetical protein